MRAGAGMAGESGGIVSDLTLDGIVINEFSFVRCARERMNGKPSAADLLYEFGITGRTRPSRIEIG